MKIIMKKETSKNMNIEIHRGIYEKYVKRGMDFILSLIALIVLSPLLLFLTVCGTFIMGGNPFFLQKRPGKDEKIFKLIKYRTMTNKKDKEGKFLPDEKRLTSYGKILRKTSLDELPELFNILAGQLTICGPRPQLVRDLVFMNDKQRRRHKVCPGLTGLAQINGRNNITWEKKIEWDLKYIDNGITLRGDIYIIFKTIGKVLKRLDIVREGTASDMDFGDWLMITGKISQDYYYEKQEEAKKLLQV